MHHVLDQTTDQESFSYNFVIEFCKNCE